MQCELPVEMITVQQGRRGVYFTVSGVEEVMSVSRGQNMEMGTHCKRVGSLGFSEMPRKHCLVIACSLLEAGFFWPLIQKVPGCFKNLKPS